MKAYLAWLDRHDVSRPHRTGRWRVRQADTLIIDLLSAGGPLAVGGFFSEKPCKADHAHVARWRASDERRHKENAWGFLRMAKHRHAPGQLPRARAMCHSIGAAMRAFAAGDMPAGEAAMRDAWGEYMLLMTIGNAPMTIKGAMIPVKARTAQEASTDAKNAKKKPLGFFFAAAVKTLGAVPGHVALCQATKAEIERIQSARGVARDQIDAMKKQVGKRSATDWLNKNYPDRPARGTLARKRTKTE